MFKGLKEIGAEEERKAAEAEALEERQRAGRVETDKQADLLRLKFQDDQQQEQIILAIESLQQSKEDFSKLKQLLEDFVTKKQELQSSKTSNQEQFTKVHRKIKEMLDDPQVQKGLLALKKTVQTVEQLFDDVDFSADPDVSKALEIRGLINGIDQQLITLREEENNLYQKIQEELGLKSSSVESERARTELQQSLEAQIKQLDEEIKVLELQTPEGKKRAETELTKILEGSLRHEDLSREVNNIYSIAEYLLKFNLLGRREDTLFYKDILGEAKFLEILQAVYNKQLDIYANSYKKRVGLDKWEMDFETIDNYKKKLQETMGQDGLMWKLSEKTREAQEQLVQFFLSEEGKPILIEIAEISIKENFLIDNKGNQYNVGLKYKEDSLLDSVKKNPEGFASRVAEILIQRSGEVINYFVLNKTGSLRDRDWKQPTIITSLYDQLNSISKDLSNKNYSSLPEIVTIQEGISQTENFYQKLMDNIQNPESLMDMVKALYTVNARIYLPNDRRGIRDELKLVLSNFMFYSLPRPDLVGVSRSSNSDDSERFEESVKKFVSLMPKIDSTKISTVKFENASFIVKPEDRNRDEAREKIATKSEEIKKINDFVEKLRQELVAKRAEYNLVMIEIDNLERSPKHQGVKIFTKTKGQQAVATQVSDGLSVLSGKINEGRNISLRERYQQDGFNKYIKVEDVETENFNQRNKELHGEIESKKKKLAELEREGRPGLLTFRRKDWDREVADLKESISQLEAEEKDIKKRMEVLDSINKDLLKLSTILTLVFSRLPGEYKRFDSDGVITVGQVYEKLSQLIQDIMSKQVTSEQREFAGDYKALKDRAEKLKISIEAKARDLGLRSPYLQL